MKIKVKRLDQKIKPVVMAVMKTFFDDVSSSYPISNSELLFIFNDLLFWLLVG